MSSLSSLQFFPDDESDLSRSEAEGLLIVGIQPALRDCLTVEDREANVRTMVSNIQEVREKQLAALPAGTAAPPATLFLLPELSTTGYHPDTFDKLHLLAEDLSSSPSLCAFAELARSLSCYICFGFPRIHQPPSHYSIAQALINPKGELECWYDKLHLCNYGECSETRWFSKTEESRVAVFEIAGVKLGIGICYDIRFPEFFRQLAIEHHVDVILHPGGWPRDSCFSTWHPFVITRSVENQIVIFSINRAGVHFGGSMVAGPWVDQETFPLITADRGPSVLLKFVSKSLIQQVRLQYRLRDDRLPSYSSLPS